MLFFDVKETILDFLTGKKHFDQGKPETDDHRQLSAAIDQWPALNFSTVDT